MCMYITTAHDHHMILQHFLSCAGEAWPSLAPGSKLTLVGDRGGDEGVEA